MQAPEAPLGENGHPLEPPMRPPTAMVVVSSKTKWCLRILSLRSVYWYRSHPPVPKGSQNVPHRRPPRGPTTLAFTDVEAMQAPEAAKAASAAAEVEGLRAELVAARAAAAAAQDEAIATGNSG